ncbi:hypothetical protein CRN84_17305 [Budvicia aquatica]|uniref:Uncharacterized protein n=1 Tax=Budvicia aquatica TaxID=82979 RepID=A0A2C6D1E2_9GAMM|nr:hypothetical protein CRN84_17305 [Budvicia aquatica]
MVLLLLWVGASVVIGLCAQSRGRSFWLWFVISMIFDPLAGVIFYNIVVRLK